jgi:hypothetical protein
VDQPRRSSPSCIGVAPLANTTALCRRTDGSSSSPSVRRSMFTRGPMPSDVSVCSLLMKDWQDLVVGWRAASLHPADENGFGPHMTAPSVLARTRSTSLSCRAGKRRGALRDRFLGRPGSPDSNQLAPRPPMDRGSAPCSRARRGQRSGFHVSRLRLSVEGTARPCAHRHVLTAEATNARRSDPSGESVGRSRHARGKPRRQLRRCVGGLGTSFDREPAAQPSWTFSFTASKLRQSPPDRPRQV